MHSRFAIFLCGLFAVSVLTRANAAAPAATYTPEQMMRRLIAIAEAPKPPEPGELADEFGLQFTPVTAAGARRWYRAEGVYPLSDARWRGAFFIEDRFGSIEVGLMFAAPGITTARPYHHFCMDKNALQALLQKRWTYRPSTSPSTLPTYHATINQQARVIVFDPPSPAGCVYEFSITFKAPLEQKK
jgi:hypothetical protein